MTTVTITPQAIDACPICGGELQATVKIWTSAVTIKRDPDGKGFTVVDEGYRVYEDTYDDINVYCENDHDEKEITRALKA